jgi:hypothetical protein
LTEDSLTASLTVFFLGENCNLCLSEHFSLTIGVELKHMASGQEWHQKPEDLFSNGGALKDVIA